MTQPRTMSLFLPTEAQTATIGRKLASMLAAGDVITLSGPIGAGKSLLARALIKARLIPLGLDEDVPSPSFTLVQSYQAGPLEIWHCDLYRLSDPDEVMELGLEDAFADALCLIEWPDRLGSDVPDSALSLTLGLRSQDEGRDLLLSWTDPAWTDRLASVDLTPDAH